MATATEHLALTAAPSTRSRLPRLIGSALAWLATSFAALTAFSGLGVESSTCAGDCTALATSAGSALFGVPVLALAFGLHLALWSALTVAAFTHGTRLGQALHTLVFSLAAVLLLGTAVYLTWGLALGLACHLCLTLHAAALVAAIGVFVAGLGEPLATRDTLGPFSIAALVALLMATGGAALGHLRHNQRLASHRAVDTTLAAVCEAGDCPSAAVFPRAELPREALVLTEFPQSPAPTTTMLLYVDFECSACRRELATMGQLLRELVTTRRAGLAVLLRAEASACDDSARGGDPARCEAPAALVCATRHGRGTAALAYLDWELAASPGYYTLEDRRAWLAQRVDPEARQCLDDELRLGRFGAVSRHAEAARTLRASALSHPGCGGSTQADSEPFWCFASTPSIGLFTHRAPQPLTTARELALGRLTGSARARLLDTCLQGP